MYLADHSAYHAACLICSEFHVARVDVSFPGPPIHVVMSGTWWTFNKYLFNMTSHSWKRGMQPLIFFVFFSVFMWLSFIFLQVNNCLNMKSPNYSSYHTCSHEDQLKKPRGDHLFSVEFMLAIWFVVSSKKQDLVSWPGPRSQRMSSVIRRINQMGSLPLRTGPETAPGTVTEGWQLYMFKITSWWSQSHSLSSGALPRVWHKHIRNAHGDNDVYVFSLNLSGMAASLEKRRELRRGRPALPPSVCLPWLEGWTPWDFLFFFWKKWHRCPLHWKTLRNSSPFMPTFLDYF